MKVIDVWIRNSPFVSGMEPAERNVFQRKEMSEVVICFVLKGNINQNISHTI
jgi:hypothetical protein